MSRGSLEETLSLRKLPQEDAVSQHLDVNLVRARGEDPANLCLNA